MPRPRLSPLLEAGIGPAERDEWQEGHCAPVPVTAEAPSPRDPVRWALSKVLITVLDINDFRPQFSKSQFSTSVYENEPSGTSVITMTATDLDEGDNGVVTYSIEGPGAGRSRWWGAPTHGQGSCRVAVRGQATLSVPGGWLASRLCMLSQEQPLSVLLHHSQFLVA